MSVLVKYRHDMSVKYNTKHRAVIHTFCVGSRVGVAILDQIRVKVYSRYLPWYGDPHQPEASIQGVVCSRTSVRLAACW